MSDQDKDVLIAVYLFEDLAKRDFDAVLKLAEDKRITVEGVVLVQKDADGQVHVTETGDHLGRKGLAIGGGAGLVVGLFAPPLLAATAIAVAVATGALSSGSAGASSSSGSLEGAIAAAQAHAGELSAGIGADSHQIAGYQGSIDDLQRQLGALESSLAFERNQLAKLKS